MPIGFEEALLKAKKKVAEGKPLGFNVEEMLRIARAKAEKFQPEKNRKLSFSNKRSPSVFLSKKAQVLVTIVFLGQKY